MIDPRRGTEATRTDAAASSQLVCQKAKCGRIGGPRAGALGRPPASVEPPGCILKRVFKRPPRPR